MKFSYIAVQNPDGTWKMVVKLTAQQLRDVEKARRRILNIKDLSELMGGDEIKIPLMYNTQIAVEHPRMNAIIYGITGV